MWRWRVCVLLLAVMAVGVAVGSASALRINASIVQSFSYPVNLTVSARVTLSPAVLREGSAGGPVTARIQLPAGFDPAQIVLGGVRLCYAPAGCAAALSTPGSLDGGQRIVQFARSAVLSLLTEVRAPASVVLTVEGTVADGVSYRPFSGSVSLRLLAAG